MSKDKGKDKVAALKNKTRELRKEIKKLRSRNRELSRSRENWKQKYKKEKKTVCKESGLGEGLKAKGHRHPLWVNEYCLRLCQYGGISLRSCRESLMTLSLVMGLSLSVPSHVSIRNWQLKLGYYRHARREGRGTRPGRWALIVDESITLGAERLLVVLGVDVGAWGFERCLGLGDVDVLYMGCGKEWKKEDVQKALESASSGLEVLQVVSDRGSNLLNAYKLSSMLYVPDCSHDMARILERHLSGHLLFKAMNEWCGQLRQCWTTSRHVKWCPPRYRGKSRFMNVFPQVKWAERTLGPGAEMTAAVREKMEWLFQNRAFVEGLCSIRKVVEKVLKCLKVKGASLAAIQQARLAGQEGDLDDTGKKIWYDILAYLDELEEKCLKVKQPLLCCSDVIESLFGRFKYRVNPVNGISDMALAIPTLCGKISKPEIRTALENTKMKEVKLWKRK